jgi:hypothetical protein
MEGGEFGRRFRFCLLSEADSFPPEEFQAFVISKLTERKNGF